MKVILFHVGTIVCISIKSQNKNINPVGLFQVVDHEISLPTEVLPRNFKINHKKQDHSVKKIEFKKPNRLHKQKMYETIILDVEFISVLKKADTNPWRDTKSVNIQRNYESKNSNVRRLGRNRFRNRYLKKPGIRNPSSHRLRYYAYKKL